MCHDVIHFTSRCRTERKTVRFGVATFALLNEHKLTVARSLSLAEPSHGFEPESKGAGGINLGSETGWLRSFNLPHGDW